MAENKNKTLCVKYDIANVHKEISQAVQRGQSPPGSDTRAEVGVGDFTVVEVFCFLTKEYALL